MVSKMVEELDRMGALGGFNLNLMRDFLQGFQDEITNETGGEREGMMRRVEEGEAKIRIPLRRSQVFAWSDYIHLLI